MYIVGRLTVLIDLLKLTHERHINRRKLNRRNFWSWLHCQISLLPYKRTFLLRVKQLLRIDYDTSNRVGMCNQFDDLFFQSVDGVDCRSIGI